MNQRGRWDGSRRADRPRRRRSRTLPDRQAARRVDREGIGRQRCDIRARDGMMPAAARGSGACPTRAPSFAPAMGAPADAAPGPHRGAHSDAGSARFADTAARPRDDRTGRGTVADGPPRRDPTARAARRHRGRPLRRSGRPRRRAPRHARLPARHRALPRRPPRGPPSRSAADLHDTQARSASGAHAPPPASLPGDRPPAPPRPPRRASPAVRPSSPSLALVAGLAARPPRRRRPAIRWPRRPSPPSSRSARSG